MLVNLFRLNYGIEKLSEATRLDGSLLRFLTLLNIWVRNHIDGLQGHLFHIAPDMLAALQRVQIINNFLRQRWLHTRAGSTTFSSPTTKIDALDQGLSAHGSVSELLHIQEHILPQFIHISKLIQPEQAELTEKWMLLASRLMINAAIEIMDSPDFLSLGKSDAKLSIEQCFAWGYVPRLRYGSDSPLRRRLLAEIQSKAPKLAEDATEECERLINDALDREDDCVVMFLDPERQENGMDVDGPKSAGEWSDWTRIRQEALDTVLAIFDAVIEEMDDDRLAPIRWLKNQYRLSTLLADIGVFFELTWEGYRSPEWHGKPILIQIEQGGIEGLSDEEFRTFRRQAGIV